MKSLKGAVMGHRLSGQTEWLLLDKCLGVDSHYFDLLPLALLISEALK